MKLSKKKTCFCKVPRCLEWFVAQHYLAKADLYFYLYFAVSFRINQCQLSFRITFRPITSLSWIQHCQWGIWCQSYSHEFPIFGNICLLLLYLKGNLVGLNDWVTLFFYNLAYMSSWLLAWRVATEKSKVTWLFPLYVASFFGGWPYFFLQQSFFFI